MASSDDQRDDYIPPWIHLLSSLDSHRDEHERLYAAPVDSQEEQLHKALDTISDFALQVFEEGKIPPELETRLEDYKPWDPINARVSGLLAYTYVQRRAELDLAEGVVNALRDANRRIAVLFGAFLLLQTSHPSPTAFKYLRQAARLYLAGYRAEVFIMCGDVLEAAMATRFPDEILLAIGMKPAYRTTGVFSIGQRIQVEVGAGVLTPSDRERFW